MAKVVMGDDFRNAVKTIRKLPLEDRRSKFFRFSSECRSQGLSLDIVLFMSAVYGGKEGEAWFREAVPLSERLSESKKIKEMSLSKKTLYFIERAYFGTTTVIKRKDTPKVTGKVKQLNN